MTEDSGQFVIFYQSYNHLHTSLQAPICSTQLALYRNYCCMVSYNFLCRSHSIARAHSWPPSSCSYSITIFTALCSTVKWSPQYCEPKQSFIWIHFRTFAKTSFLSTLTRVLNGTQFSAMVHSYISTAHEYCTISRNRETAINSFTTSIYNNIFLRWIHLSLRRM